jgi:hypothetical protein
MVSEQALARQRRFLEAKSQHGDAAGVQKYHTNLPWYVWFNQQGDIMGVSKQNDDKPADLLSAVFSQEQISILTDKSWAQFRVRTDDLNKSVHYLEVKPVEHLIVSSDFDFLNKVEISNSKTYDLRLTVLADCAKITLHSNLIARYSEVDPGDITARGYSELRFYFTTPNNPCFLFHTVTIKLLDLVKNKQVVVSLAEDLRHCDIYTVKVFDKYLRHIN